MTPETEIEKAILENGIGMFAICAESENGFDYWIMNAESGFLFRKRLKNDIEKISLFVI